MCIVHPFDPDGPAVFDCAQSGCQDCLDALMGRHDGLVHVVLRRQSRGSEVQPFPPMRVWRLSDRYGEPWLDPPGRRDGSPWF